MQKVNDLKILLSAFENYESLSAIIQEVNTGIEFYLDVSGKELSKNINQCYLKYGNTLKFRVFNAELDANWLGHYGILIDEKIEHNNSINVYFESDTKRHPGMLALDQNLDSLKKYRLQAQVVDEGRYLRLGKILKEVE